MTSPRSLAWEALIIERRGRAEIFIVKAGGKAVSKVYRAILAERILVASFLAAST